jgi:aminoglycoside phosphotransferase (APT) family kinase protein
MDEELLHGGVANAGAVTRVGTNVLRPSNPHSRSIHRFLAAIADAGFDGASVPLGIDDDGRERLVYIEGDVPVPPYPAWAQTDEALASIARLLRRFHDASRGYDPTLGTWSDEMRDPAGGTLLCHNDVCLENVVFRDGVAVGLVDFDFLAPGRELYDLSQFARMCVPVDDDLSASRLGFTPADRPARLRLVAESYGLERDDRLELIEILSGTIQRGGEFVLRRVQAGEASFIQMWDQMGGMERFDRRRLWWAEQRWTFVAAMR